jgi:hypothetical protein
MGKKKGEGVGERGRGKGSSPRGSKYGDNRHQDLGHNGEERERWEREGVVRRRIE